MAYRLDDILARCDVLNVLRIQFERQRSGLFPSIQEYFRLFGVHSECMRVRLTGLLYKARDYRT